jgi:hypothetical protein
MPLVTVYDAVAVGTIPPEATCFLAYDSTIGPLLARFPHPRKVWRVTTSGSESELDQDICDCESGDATPEDAADWAAEKIAAKAGRPCIYVEVANKPLVETALAQRGLAFGEQVDCWLAWWNGEGNVPNGIYNGVGCGQGNVAHQFFRQGEFTYDVSVALSEWAFPGQEANDMLFIKEQSGEVYWFIAAGAASYWRLVPPKAVGMLPAAWLVPDDGTWLALWKVA